MALAAPKVHGTAAVHPPEPTHEASAEPSSLELCLARRRKTTVNPVKAGIVEHVKDYEYSSWGEFDGTVDPVFQICDTRTVLNRIPFKELEEPTNEARADESSLSVCLARRRKTIVNGSTTRWTMMSIA